MCEEYNGWTNRETWAVALWINNEQGMQESVHEALRDALPVVAEEDNGPDAPMLSVQDAGQIVQAWIDDLFDCENYGNALPGPLVNMLTDIGSLYRVNWDEIGANFLAALTDEDQS